MTMNKTTANKIPFKSSIRRSVRLDLILSSPLQYGLNSSFLNVVNVVVLLDGVFVVVFVDIVVVLAVVVVGRLFWILINFFIESSSEFMESSSELVFQ